MKMNWDYIGGYFDGEGHVRRYVRGGGRNGSGCGVQWSNTHLESLEAIRAFMNCGAVYLRKRASRPQSLQSYDLVVTKQRDLKRILPHLIRHTIVKREKLIELQVAIADRREGKAWTGALKALGPVEVHRLYWDEGLTLEDIGKIANVRPETVWYFMRRNEIPRRPPWESPNRRRIRQV